MKPFISLYKKYKRLRNPSLKVQYFTTLNSIYVIFLFKENEKDKKNPCRKSIYIFFFQRQESDFIVKKYIYKPIKLFSINLNLTINPIEKTTLSLYAKQLFCGEKGKNYNSLC